MSWRQGIEFGVGTGLLLGPLIYVMVAPVSTETLSCETESARATVVVEQPAEACEPVAVSEPVAVEESADVEEPVDVEEPADVEEPVDVEEPASFLFVYDDRVVLSTAAKAEWGKGELMSLPGSAERVAGKTVDPEALPSELRARGERSYDLYGPRGLACTAGLRNLRVITQFDGWGAGEFLDGDWSETYPDDVPDALIDAGMWAKSEEYWLVADIDPEAKCGSASWARDAALERVPVLIRTDATSSWTRTRIDGFYQSEDFDARRRDYEAWYGDLEPQWRSEEETWGRHAKRYPAQARSWVDGTGGVQFVEFEFGDEGEGCGEGIDTRYTDLSKVEGGALVPSSGAYGAISAFDVDLDGDFEFLMVEEWAGGMWLNSSSEALDLGLSVDGSFDCPC